MAAKVGAVEITPWVETADLGAILVDVALPVAAILVPTVIAIRLARSERRNAEHDRREERRVTRADRHTERRLEAGAGVIEAVAPLASMMADQPMQEYLWRLRARIAVYRAWIRPDDGSGDWLALRHREGMLLWQDALGNIGVIGGPGALGGDDMLELLRPAHEWAASTTEMFTGFLSGQVASKDLLEDGARILEKYPRAEDRT